MIDTINNHQPPEIVGVESVTASGAQAAADAALNRIKGERPCIVELTRKAWAEGGKHFVQMSLGAGGVQ